MAEHSELVTEMCVVEKMSTQERLKHAKKRRQQQLKKWTQHERDLQKGKHKLKTQRASPAPQVSEYKVHFVPSVMLLEAAARNDVDEGKLVPPSFLLDKVSAFVSCPISPDVLHRIADVAVIRPSTCVKAFVELICS